MTTVISDSGDTGWGVFPEEVLDRRQLAPEVIHGVARTPP